MIAERKTMEQRAGLDRCRDRAVRILQSREIISLQELAGALGMEPTETLHLMSAWERERRVKTLRPVQAEPERENRPTHIYYRWARQDDADASWQLRVRLKQVAQPPRLSALAFRFSPAY